MKKSIGFYDYAWSPVTGCLHGCDYCYGKTDFRRRGLSYEPELHLEVLREPLSVKPSTIFVTHYTDLMGEFIPAGWVDKILKVTWQLPIHEFIFITKNPIRYYQFDFPDNCMLGVTIESPDKLWRSKIMEDLGNDKMASIEPIMGDFTGFDFSQYSLVVVGGMMNRKYDTKGEWVNSIKHENIYYKPNIRKFLR